MGAKKAVEALQKLKVDITMYAEATIAALVALLEVLGHEMLKVEFDQLNHIINKAAMRALGEDYEEEEFDNNDFIEIYETGVQEDDNLAEASGSTKPRRGLEKVFRV